MTDYGKHGMTSNPKLFAFDLRKKDELVKEYSFPSAVAGFGSMLNDFQVHHYSEWMSSIALTSCIYCCRWIPRATTYT